jgi:sugar phosphate permease
MYFEGRHTSEIREQPLVMTILRGVIVWSAQYLSQAHKFYVIKLGAVACVYFTGGTLVSCMSSFISDRFLGGRMYMVLAYH